MIPNPSFLNEEVPQDVQQKYATLSYTSFHQMLSPPANYNPHPQIKEKTKSDARGLIDSKAAEDYLIRVIQQNDDQEIKNLLDEASNVLINSITDNRKYTLLHLAAYNNNIENIRLLIDHVKKQYKHKSKQILTEWVNKQTEDGFAAFHFAAYRGNIQIIQELEKCGANIFLLNSQGMNGLHLAAQGDQPRSIVYFRKVGFDFTQKDGKGGTPFHWAAYYGCELALKYLLSFASEIINQQDSEGLTALHLASMSGNTRIIKKLILKGADKSIKNKAGLTAADIAKQNNFVQIHKMLTQGESWFLQYFNISQGLKKTQRRKDKMVKFILMFLFCSSLSYYYLYLSKATLLMTIFSLLTLVEILFFFLLWRSDPGRIVSFNYKKESKMNEKHSKLFFLLTQYEPQDICPDCVIMIQKRSKHCDICQQCIKYYDHHCPWVDNCIGSNNHFIFFVFVITICVSITLSIVLQIYFFAKFFSKLVPNFSGESCAQFAYFLASSIILCMFVIPLWFLFLVQCKNLLSGKTTYERYSAQNSRKLQQEQVHYSLRNCFKMCFDNRRVDHLTNPEQQVYVPLLVTE